MNTENLAFSYIKQPFGHNGAFEEGAWSPVLGRFATCWITGDTGLLLRIAQFYPRDTTSLTCPPPKGSCSCRAQDYLTFSDSICVMTLYHLQYLCAPVTLGCISLALLTFKLAIFFFPTILIFFPFEFFSHCEKTMVWVQVLILFAENVALPKLVNLLETQSWRFASLERLSDFHGLSVKLNEHQSYLAQVLASLLFPLLSIPLGMTSKKGNFPDENCTLKPSVPSFHMLKRWTELLFLLLFFLIGLESWVN